jgi:hypothetical protein
LADILSLESADMYWYKFYKNKDTEWTVAIRYEHLYDGEIPCWSLESLLDVLPEIDNTSLILEKVKAEDGYDGYYYHIEYKDKILIPYSKNPIDACVAMIEKLKELKML